MATKKAPIKKAIAAKVNKIDDKQAKIRPEVKKIVKKAVAKKKY
jgi:hypothetical protein